VEIDDDAELHYRVEGQADARTDGADETSQEAASREVQR